MSGSAAIQALIAAKQAQRKKRVLTNAEKKRLQKLEGLLEQLKRKENVQNRTLKTWLTPSEYGEIDDSWNEQKVLRAEIKDKPAVLLRYEKMLKKAIFTHNRAEGMSGKGNSKAASNLHNMAEAQCEKALEFLHENVTLNPSLVQWLDRDVDISPNGNLSLSPVGMPRVITSRSLDKETGGLETAKMTKVEVKASVVERAIDRLKFDVI
jgi:hypothetical protein